MKKNILLLIVIFVITLISFIGGKYSYIIFGDFYFKFVNIKVCNNTDLDFKQVRINYGFLISKKIKKGTCNNYISKSIFMLNNNNLEIFLDDNKYFHVSGPLNIEGPSLNDLTFFGNYTINVSFSEKKDFIYEIIKD